MDTEIMKNGILLMKLKLKLKLKMTPAQKTAFISGKGHLLSRWSSLPFFIWKSSCPFRISESLREGSWLFSSMGFS